MAPPIALKKYPNRRLYDTENSRYVTLENVADRIREGREVRVTDVRSGEDVTAFILTQVVMEQARSRSHTLPASLLHLLIRHGENVLNDFFDSYLEKSLQSYLTYRQSMEEQFATYLEMGMDLSSLTQKAIRQMTSSGAAIPGNPSKPGSKKPSP